LKKVKSDKNMPFGIRIGAKFKPGEMVEWSGWFLGSNGETKHEVYTGVLIEVFSETMGGREVMYAKILPVNNNILLDVNVMCLRKVNDKETN
tara:strand:- start:350 stop:625 length:276 start_codon:yes stop_codon:yes gene_type:complete